MRLVPSCEKFTARTVPVWALSMVERPSLQYSSMRMILDSALLRQNGHLEGPAHMKHCNSGCAQAVAIPAINQALLGPALPEYAAAAIFDWLLL